MWLAVFTWGVGPVRQAGATANLYPIEIARMCSAAGAVPSCMRCDSQGCYSQNRNWSNLWSRKILLLEQINPNLEQITGRNTSILEHKISNLEQFNKKIYFFSAKQRMQGIQHQHNRALVSVDTKCAWQKWPTNSAGNCKAWWICTNLESMLIQVLSVFTGPSKETKNSSAPANILFVLRNAIRWPK